MTDERAAWFPGVEAPNYTAFPNELLDLVMPRVTPAEWEVVCFVVRRTEGWHRQSADISLREIMDATGLARSGAQRALASLVRQGVLVSQRNRAPDGGSRPTTYGIHLRGQGSLLSRPPSPLEETGEPPEATPLRVKERTRKERPPSRKERPEPPDDVSAYRAERAKLGL